jgi:hypothetical protein
MVSIKIFLKGWRDGRLFCDAVNDPAHALHAAAWAVRDQLWTPYKAGDEVYHAVTYTGADAEDLVHCERAFENFNVGDPHDNAVVREYRDAGNRSLSMGDVVVIDDRAYTCAAVGWARVENFAPPAH